MLINNKRISVRVALAHFDPGLYGRLQAGDEIVAYNSDNAARIEERLHEVANYLANKALTCECCKEALRVVWTIVDVIEIADAAE